MTGDLSPLKATLHAEPSKESRRCRKSVTSGQASFPPYFRGGVTPAGSGTCATFSVIDTRL